MLHSKLAPSQIEQATVSHWLLFLMCMVLYLSGKTIWRERLGEGKDSGTKSPPNLHPSSPSNFLHCCLAHLGEWPLQPSIGLKPQIIGSSLTYLLSCSTSNLSANFIGFTLERYPNTDRPLSTPSAQATNTCYRNNLLTGPLLPPCPPPHLYYSQ